MIVMKLALLSALEYPLAATLASRFSAFVSTLLFDINVNQKGFRWVVLITWSSDTSKVLPLSQLVTDVVISSTRGWLVSMQSTIWTCSSPFWHSSSKTESLLWSSVCFTGWILGFSWPRWCVHRKTYMDTDMVIVLSCTTDWSFKFTLGLLVVGKQCSSTCVVKVKLLSWIVISIFHVRRKICPIILKFQFLSHPLRVMFGTGGRMEAAFFYYILRLGAKCNVLLCPGGVDDPAALIVEESEDKTRIGD